MALHSKLIWKEGLHFEAVTREHHLFMDAKQDSGGQNKGPNPKEYVLMGLCGCTGMDVASLFKKYKLPIESLIVRADAPMTEKGHPVMFAKVDVYFEVTGPKMDEELIKKAVVLSMTKYCGVSAMLSKACPIEYSVLFNGNEILKDFAKF